MCDDNKAGGGGGCQHRYPGTSTGQPPPADPGMIPFTVAEITRLLAAWLTRPAAPGHTACWLARRRSHQALARWYHQRTRLTRDADIAQVN